MELLESYGREAPGNVNVVYYDKIKYKLARKANLSIIRSLTRPFDISRSILYFTLRNHADLIVENEENVDSGENGE